MKKNIFYLSIIILFFNNMIAQKLDSIIQRCSIVEETFDKSSIRKFLKATTNRRNIIEKFNDDNSAYAFLSIQNDDVMYAFLKNGVWKIILNDKEFTIKNKTLITKINSYAIKNTVYKAVCPEDFVMYDASTGLQAFWIKKSSKMKFLYYSTKYDVFTLDNDSQKKIKLLMEINELFKEGRNK